MKAAKGLPSRVRGINVIKEKTKSKHFFLLHFAFYVVFHFPSLYSLSSMRVFIQLGSAAEFVFRSLPYHAQSKCFAQFLRKESL